MKNWRSVLRTVIIPLTRSPFQPFTEGTLTRRPPGCSDVDVIEGRR